MKNLLFLLCLAAFQPVVQAQTLVWSDEFNLPDGSQPDPATWTIQNWYQNTKSHEASTYTNRTKNVDIWQGNLRLRMYRETYTGQDGVTKNYTAGKIYSLHGFTATHGLWVARIKMPYSYAIHSAFWLVGADVLQVGWPQSGEIDIMENIGRQPHTNHGTLHGPPPGSSYAGAGVGATFTLPNNQAFASQYHLFSINWQPNKIEFYVDNTLYETRTPADVPQGGWVFEHPFYIIFSTVVGDNWAGYPDSNTVLPQEMLVDYVRVYQ